MTDNRPWLALTMATMLVFAGLAVVNPAMAAHGDDGDVAVATEQPTDVTESAAWLQGNLTHLNDSLDSANVSFVYWTASDPANTTTVDAGQLEATGDYRAHVKDLDNDTTYAYQAVAEANGTTVNGTTVEFTTAASEIEISVETQAATNVTNSSATLNGNLTALDADASNTTVQFQYWVEGDRSTKEHTAATSMDSTGEFSADVENLTAGETYVVRAHAETEAGNYTADDRGAELTFRTFTGEFEVETLDATDVTNDSATLNGRLNGLNGSSSANVSFVYWDENDSANTTTVEAGELTAAGEFSASISGLSNNSTYVYYAAAETDTDSATGENVTIGAADDGPTWDGQGPFGQFVSSIIQMGPDGESDTPFGQWLSDVVVKNNPGNGQGPPEHAGPPEDKERGPPEDKGPNKDKERGPPEDKGPNKDDDSDDEASEE